MMGSEKMRFSLQPAPLGSFSIVYINIWSTSKILHPIENSVFLIWHNRNVFEVVNAV